MERTDKQTQRFTLKFAKYTMFGLPSFVMSVCILSAVACYAIFGEIIIEKLNVPYSLV